MRALVIATALVCAGCTLVFDPTDKIRGGSGTTTSEGSGTTSGASGSTSSGVGSGSTTSAVGTTGTTATTTTAGTSTAAVTSTGGSGTSGASSTGGTSGGHEFTDCTQGQVEGLGCSLDAGCDLADGGTCAIIDGVCVSLICAPRAGVMPDNATVYVFPDGGPVQDGTVLRLVPTYSSGPVVADGIGASLIDDVTHFRWLAEPRTESSYFAAESFCTTIHDGYWRVPTTRELVTILDFGSPRFLPAGFDLPDAGGLIVRGIVSSEVSPPTSSGGPAHYCADVTDARLSGCDDAQELAVLCIDRDSVGAVPGGARNVAVDQDHYFDSWTGLTWTTQPILSGMHFPTALDAQNSCADGGGRLATIKELATRIHYTDAGFLFDDPAPVSLDRTFSGTYSPYGGSPYTIYPFTTSGPPELFPNPSQLQQAFCVE